MSIDALIKLFIAYTFQVFMQILQMAEEILYLNLHITTISRKTLNQILNYFNVNITFDVSKIFGNNSYKGIIGWCLILFSKNTFFLRRFLNSCPSKIPTFTFSSLSPIKVVNSVHYLSSAFTDCFIRPNVIRNSRGTLQFLSNNVS